MAINPNNTHVFGAPKLAQIGALVAVVAAAGALLASISATSLAFAGIAILAAVRLMRLGLIIDDEKVVVNNLLYSRTFDRETATMSYKQADLRWRQASGIYALPGDATPKTSDDNNRYYTKVIRITDSSNPEDSVAVDIGFGLLPKAQQELQRSIEAVLA